VKYLRDLSGDDEVLLDVREGETPDANVIDTLVETAEQARSAVAPDGVALRKLVAQPAHLTRHQAARVAEAQEAVR